MSKIPTAEKLYDNFYNEQEKNNTLDGAIWEYKGDIINMMKEFAKLHIHNIRALQQCKYFAGETGYITNEEWIIILDNIK